MNNELNDFFCGDNNQNYEGIKNPFTNETWNSYKFYLQQYFP